MSAGIFGGWQKQSAMLSEKQYISPKRRDCIWKDKVTMSQRKQQLTDREMLRQRGSPGMDGFGNIKSDKREDMARQFVERAMMQMTAAERAAITPAQKWQLVENVCRGNIR